MELSTIDSPPTETAPLFELTSAYASETLRVEILHPESNAATGMWIEIESQFSRAARQAALRSTELEIDNGEVKAKQTFDDSLLEQLVAVTRAWGGFAVGGVTPACTPANVRTLYEEPRTAWIRVQVQRAYLSIARFFSTANAN